MRFLQVLAIVLTQLSISSLLIVSLLSPAALRQSFFQFHSLVCGLSAGLALLITGFVAAGLSWDVRFLALTIFGVVLGYVAFRLERPVIGRFCLIVAGLIGVVFGLMPLAGRTMAQWGVRTKAMEFFDGSFLLGAALIGTTFVSLTLAYWYQAMRRPLTNYLLWLVEAMLVVAGLRIVLLVSTLLLLRTSDPQLAEELIAALWTNNTGMLLFTVRVGAGLVVPLLTGLLALQRIREEDYERTTRVLAVALLGVVAGELCAVHLLI